MRLAFKSALAVLVLACSSFASASNRPEQFFREMAERIADGEQGEAIPMVENRVSAGYYRFVVSRTGGQNLNLIERDCEDALKDYQGNRLDRLIFDRKAEVGLSLRIPLARVWLPEDASTPIAELNLFRLKAGSGERCSINISYFDKTDRDFRTPLIPIDHSGQPSEQTISAVFAPWVNVSGNKARVDAFWTGIGAFVGLLGPVGPLLGLAGEDDSADKYRVRGQVTDSFHGLVNDVETPEGLTLAKTFTIAPASGGSHSPRSAYFDWRLNPRSEESIRLRFDVSIEYRGSIFSGARTYPNWSERKPADYEALVLGSASPELDLPRTNSGLAPRWTEIAPGIENLSRQTDLASFEAACIPALTDAIRLGLSWDDSYVLLFAIAKGLTRLTDRQVADSSCFGDPRAKSAFARFGIELADPTPPALPPTSEEKMREALNASIRLFASPSTLGSTNVTQKFDRHLLETILVGGSLSKLVDQAGAPVLEIGQGATAAISRQDLISALSKLKPFRAGCTAPRVTSRDDVMAKLEQFPAFSGLPPAQDRIVAHLLLSSSGEVLAVLLGLSGVDADGYPQVGQLWIGETLDPDDETLGELLAEMGKNRDCIERESFASFLSETE